MESANAVRPTDARRVGELSAAALLCLWAVVLVFRNWSSWGYDLSALYFAARFAAEGEWALVYAGPDHLIGYGVPAWEAEAAALGFAGADLNRYVYPPLWAALFAPLAQAVGPMAFFNGALVIFAGALVVAVLCVLRLVPQNCLSPLVGAMLAIGLMELTFPFAFALGMLQPQILLVALILLAVERALAGRTGTAGVLIAVVAAVKITPALLVLAFLACGMWRTAVVFAGAGSALLGLSLVLAGLPAHIEYVEAARDLSEIVLLSVVNPSLDAALALMAQAVNDPAGFVGRGSHSIVQPAPAASFAVAATALAGTGATLWIIRGCPVPARLAFGTAMLHQVAMFTAGFAWLHYLTLPFLLLLWLPSIWRPAQCALVTAAFAIPMSTATFAVTVDLDGPNNGMIALGAAVVIGFWGGFALAARSASRRECATSGTRRFGGGGRSDPVLGQGRGMQTTGARSAALAPARRVRITPDDLR